MGVWPRYGAHMFEQGFRVEITSEKKGLVLIRRSNQLEQPGALDF